MKRTHVHRMLTVVLGLLVMAVLLGVGSPVNMAADSQQPDGRWISLSEWQGYADPDFGWSIQYPPDWHLLPLSHDGQTEVVQLWSWRGFDLLGNDSSFIPQGEVVIEFIVESVEPQGGDGASPVYPSGTIDPSYSIVSQNSLELADRPTTRFQWKFGERRGETFYLVDGSWTYSIHVYPGHTNRSDEVQRILASLQLGQPSMLAEQRVTSIEPPAIMSFDPNSLKFPWSASDSWYFTGGPHGWGGSGARSGLDFAPGPNSKQVLKSFLHKKSVPVRQKSAKNF